MYSKKSNVKDCKPVTSQLSREISRPSKAKDKKYKRRGHTKRKCRQSDSESLTTLKKIIREKRASFLSCSDGDLDEADGGEWTARRADMCRGVGATSRR